ncbi:prealbumin-like fold domain-containing protein [Clostridium uliginosum]|uniref:SpaA-like prealbumin fold domain-containing protein n=1 Tax=Clostridium uliginosum TaxID=119641 RepID=A0A1I1RG59_9CLOT|nr:prealbumin-like fold domain-containing protein [Clostridium uliginosum]SFD33107.1 hypothetical protein SAMN05421842_1339 [Clostridium uliginosum]
MDNYKNNHYDDNKYNDINLNLSGSGQKIKYYDCDDSSCIFEILDEDLDSSNIDMEISKTIDKKDNNTKSNIRDADDKANAVNKENYTLNISESDSLDCYNNFCEHDIKGEIIVSAILNCGKERQCLEGAKINIYKLNGVCPEFIKSKLTDKLGKVIFNDLSEGCYRIIEIINKNYFDKPKYIKWNEVTISKENTKSSVLVVNNLKKNCAKNRFR